MLFMPFQGNFFLQEMGTGLTRNYFLGCRILGEGKVLLEGLLLSGLSHSNILWAAEAENGCYFRKDQSTQDWVGGRLDLRKGPCFSS